MYNENLSIKNTFRGNNVTIYTFIPNLINYNIQIYFTKSLTKIYNIVKVKFVIGTNLP